MKILDTATTEIVKGNSARYYSKYVVDGKEHTETLNNFKFLNMTNPNNEITIGNTCSSSVTFSIYMPAISLENKEITVFEGVKVDTEIKYIQLGIFTVTKQTSDGEYTSYEAYDRMYKADMPYFSDMTFPSTDKDILNEICGKLGISLATNIATEHTISDKPEGYTYREIIGYMAMLQGCNAVINSDGNLELRWYKDSGYVLDGHKYYQQGVTFTTSKDFIIQKLTCNNTKSGSTEQSQITSGDGATGLSFANPFMTQAILDEVYKKIGGFTFRPLTVKFLGDWRLEVGDIITVNKGGVDYKVPIMQITHECDGGLMDTVTSIGQSDMENTSVASGPITKQMERYYADLITVNKALINKLDVDTAKITYATITNLNATNASIDNLKTNKLDATYADIINANVESLKAVNADIANLKVGYEKVGILDASVADIKTLIFGSATGTTITTDFSNSVIAVLGEAQIKSAMIDSLDASKITALDINTTNVLVHSEDGKSQWKDNTIQISDSNRVRVQIGKDANSDYNMYIWDKSGNLMFDAIGLTDKGIQRQVIRDDIVKDNADIAASKLNIESLFNVINNDGSHTLNSTKIYVDSEQQTLDSVFKSIQTTVGGNSTLWGSAIKQSKDFIDQKLWWTDIRNGESIESKFNTVTSTLDSFGVQIGDVYKQLNDDFKVYQVTYEPAKDNYPANEWSVPIYPSDDRYPSDSTWEYTEAEYDNYVGIIAYWEAQNRAWRWIKKIDGTHGWKEISSTEIAYLLNQNAALKVNLNTISSELSKTQIDIRDNYSTTVQVNNAITQAVSAESNSIKLEVSNNYATKKSLESYATNDSLKSYATTASLDLYIKKDPTTGELKSAIEAIADDITLNASGTINISGNKSVDINGNLFTLTSTNTTISADGRATFKAGTIGNWSIEQNKLSSTVQVYIPPDINVINTISGAIKAETTSSLSKSLYDFNGDGTIDLFDFAKAKRFYLGLETYNNTTSAIAQLSNVTANIDPANLDKVINISGTDMWGTKRETYIGINGLKTDSVKSRDAYLSYMTIDGGNSNYSTDSNYALNAQSIKSNEIYVNGLKVASSVLMMCPTSNIQIYNNPRDMYGNPVLCMDNPISFAWSDGILRIYVDNTVVASWDWGSGTWSN
nr:MAG TPA: Minor structural protein [Caudoviricetes sp.]